ncbi:MAG: DNA primase [Calothrix sp. SM1_5_4]|nr:DNA primase [Calothrix sp. SM1_5_4]
MEYLARRAGIPLPEAPREAGEGSGAKDSKQNLFKVNALAAQFYHGQLKRLPDGDPVRRYLQQRGLSEELVNAFKLGYAPDAWSDLSRYFESKRVPMTVAEQLGLCKRRTGGKSGHYDLFRHRLMFPIFSPTGQCLGFGGRVLSPEHQPKYLNSPDSPVFHKGGVFYGLDHSAKFIRSEDEVIVVEGYMDWLALARASINNAVATLGTALTPEHAKLIKRYTQRVLLLFDGDEAGKAAARRSLPILLSEGLLARGLFLPEALDPDEFIKKRGAPELRELIAGAPDLFDLVSTEQWIAAKGSPTGKVQLLDELAPVLARTQDPRLRRLYAGNLANMVDVELRMVEQSVARVNAPGGQGRIRPAAAPRVENVPAAQAEAHTPATQIDLGKVVRAELELLNMALMKEEYLQEALRADIGDKFSHPGARALFSRIAEVYARNPAKFDSLSAQLAGDVRPPEAITRFLSEPYASLPDDAARKLLGDCVKRIKDTYLRSKSKELVSTLRGQVLRPRRTGWRPLWSSIRTAKTWIRNSFGADALLR